MLDQKFERGFPQERLERFSEPKIKKDDKGFYIMTLSENVKVYIEDFYVFLEELWDRVRSRLEDTDRKLSDTDSTLEETTSFYRSQRIIFNILLRTIKSFYTDGSNLGVIMSPWCALERLYSRRLKCTGKNSAGVR